MLLKRVRITVLCIFCIGVFTSTVLYSQSLSVNSSLDLSASRVVVLNNQSGELPLKQLPGLNLAALHFSSKTADALKSISVFDSIANKYWKCSSIMVDSSGDNYFARLHDRLKLFNYLVIDIADEQTMDASIFSFISQLQMNRRLAFVVRGKEDFFQKFDAVKVPVLWCNDKDEKGASFCAQLLFGGAETKGRLEKNYGANFKKGKGFTITKSRLGYSTPEAVALNSGFTTKIDSIVAAGIYTHSTPGAVILLIKDGKVIFDKAYGTHMYNDTVLTRVNDIFDMASVTKVTATTPLIMQLYDKKEISIDSPISRYVQVLQAIPDKREQTVREALLHEAGFTPYIKFYEKLTPLDLSGKRSERYPTEIADNFFLRRDYFRDIMWPVTLQSPVLTRGKFVYSDVSMYMMKEVIENVSHRKLDEHILNDFYLPLGMQSSGFLPRLRFDESRIVPTTENDNWVRNMRVTGFVNDPGAAMAGGVEGHAGLFSTSNDLAIFYQMLLNKGTYGGTKFLEASTVELFTSRQSKTSGRGLGYAKAADTVIAGKSGPSSQAFGHSGYTGTYVWVDPAYNIVYVCLTNRVYPDDGKTFGPAKVNIRAQVLDVFYQAVIAGIKQ